MRGEGGCPRELQADELSLAQHEVLPGQELRLVRGAGGEDDDDVAGLLGEGAVGLRCVGGSPRPFCGVPALRSWHVVSRVSVPAVWSVVMFQADCAAPIGQGVGACTGSAKLGASHWGDLVLRCPRGAHVANDVLAALPLPKPNWWLGLLLRLRLQAD